MANFFEQFHDTPEPAAPAGIANYFSRFHPEGPPERVDSPATTPAKAPEKKFGLEDTWPAKLAKSLYSAVTLPGDVMAGKAHVPGSEDAQAIPGAVPFGSPDSSGERIADLAMVGTPQSVANGSGKLIAEAAGLGKPPIVSTAAPTIPELKAAATAGYENPEVKSLVVKPTAIKNFGEAAETVLTNEGFSDEFAGKTFSILRRLQKIPDEAMVTGDNLNTLRKMFGKAAESTDATEAKAAAKVIGYLDEALPKVPQSEVVSGDIGAAAKVLEDARGNYSAAMHAETIDKKAVQAELRAAAANSGQNVANTVRQRMADILIKPDLQRGFSKDELGLMEQIVRGTKTQNALRTAGNVMGGGGGLGAAVTGAVGALVTPGGIGGLIPVAGYGLKALSNKLALRDVEKLSEMIRSNAPLASSMQKFEEAASGFSQERNPRTVAAVSIAARNLASNLKDAGFKVSTSDVMNGLQMSGVGRADQQDQVPREPRE